MPDHLQPWAPSPAPRRPRRRRTVVAIVAACVLGAAVFGAAIAGAVSLGRSLGQAMAGQSAPPGQTQNPVDPSGLGTDAGLNGYATRCHDGDMQACDDLFDQAPPMTRYEEYGMTCGGRVKSFDVDYCTDLN